MRYLLLLTAALAWPCPGCGNEQTARTHEPAPAEPIPEPVTVTADAMPADAAPDAGLAIESLRVAPASSESEALDALGAVPVWEAVVERGKYLARRHQRGVTYGRLGGVVAAALPGDAGPVSRYRWLVDETEGAGSLAIRLLVDGLQELAEGERLAVWGAWHVDEERAWYWRPTRVAILAWRELAVPPDSVEPPGHEVIAIPQAPDGAIPVFQLIAELASTAPGAQRAGGPVDVLFEVTRIPVNPASGWEIAARSRDQPVARLFLPGERGTYGAQDLRSPDERWRLSRGVLYVARIERVAPARSGELPRLTVRAAPRRIVAAQRRSP